MAYGYSELSGQYGALHRHHDFPGSRRDVSEKYGTTHMLTWYEHEYDPNGPHQSRETRLKLQKESQMRIMVEQDWTVEQFRAEFGINVLDAEELAEVERRRHPEPEVNSFRLLEPIPLMF